MSSGDTPDIFFLSFIGILTQINLNKIEKEFLDNKIEKNGDILVRCIFYLMLMYCIFEYWNKHTKKNNFDIFFSFSADRQQLYILFGIKNNSHTSAFYFLIINAISIKSSFKYDTAMLFFI